MLIRKINQSIDLPNMKTSTFEILDKRKSTLAHKENINDIHLSHKAYMRIGDFINKTVTGALYFLYFFSRFPIKN